MDGASARGNQSERRPWFDTRIARMVRVAAWIRRSGHRRVLYACRPEIRAGVQTVCKEGLIETLADQRVPARPRHLRSQMIAVVSGPATSKFSSRSTRTPPAVDASRAPSGDQATVFTRSVWPASVSTSAPVAAS